MQTSLFAFLLLAAPLSAIARQNDEATRPMIRRRAQGISQPNPDVCQNFAVYAGGALAFAATNTIESGDVGAFGAISGLSTLSDGNIVKDTSAFADDTAALHAQLMAVRPDGFEFITGDIGGRTFAPGTYRADSAITIVSDVILDGGGDPNSLFLFQVLSMATTAGTSIILTNGAKAENVVWVISTASAHGATSVIQGFILAGGAITFGAGFTLHGCAISRAAVLFGAGVSVKPTISEPQLTAAPVVTAVPSTSPSQAPTDTIVDSISREVCQNFAVHAGAALTFAAGNTIKSGDVGAGAAISGTAALLDGNVVADSSLFATDTVARNAMYLALPAGSQSISGDIGGTNFTAGTYSSDDSAITIESNVFLDGDGDENSQFIFQARSLVTFANTNIVLTNGAKAENVLWVFSAASVHGADSIIEGSILAGGSITTGAGVILHGCAVSLTTITFGAGGSVELMH